MVATTSASAVNDTFGATRPDGVGAGCSRGQPEAPGHSKLSMDRSLDIGCLLVDAVGLTMDNDREPLRDVSFIARPGSLTAITGPCGAGKSTLAKPVAGIMTPPPAVSLDGYDIHVTTSAPRSRCAWKIAS